MNNGYFGIKKSNIFGDTLGLDTPQYKSNTTPKESKSSIGSSLAMGAGAGLSLVGGIMDMFAQHNTREQLYQQADLANKQYNLQLNQITANQNIADINSLQKAGSDIGSQLTKAGTTGMSLQSSAINSQIDNTIRNQQIMSFNNDMTATLQRMNSAYNQVNTLSEIQERERASQMGSIGSFISSGVGLAATAGMFL